MGTKREVKKECRCILPQWHHSGDAKKQHRETERKKSRNNEREREKRVERECASTAEKGETHMETKRDVKIGCRNVPSQ